MRETTSSGRLALFSHARPTFLETQWQLIYMATSQVRIIIRCIRMLPVDLTKF